MKLSQFTAADLVKIGKLFAEKESLVLRLNQINAQIDSYGTGGTVTGAPLGGRRRGRPPGAAKLDGILEGGSFTKAKARKGKRGPRKGQKLGKLKESLLLTLKQSGTTGLTVSELAEKLGTKPNNVYSWFYTTGKKIPGIKKSADGKYTLSE